jgi:predicted TPR repeat methyltransferase
VNSPQSIEELLQAGGAALAAGRAADARILYRNILEISPRHSVARHALGWIEYQAGNAGGAVSLLEQSLDANPSDPGCWNNLGIVYASLRRHEQAAGAYRRAAALQPEFPAAFLNLGNALRNLGKWGEAVDAYQNAVRLKPDFAAAHHALGTALREAGRAAEAIDSYRRALELAPSSAADVFNDLGLAFARQGDIRRAEVHFRRAVELQPHSPRPLRNLGQLLLRTGQSAAAAEALAALVRLEPGSADAHHELGTALAQSGRLDEAVTHLRRAVALRPDHATAQCNLGVALEEKGDVAGAATAFAAARRLRPDSPVIAYHHAALAGRGADAPPACPPQYLVELFDGYADRFDEHLVKRLNYRGPELLRDAVAAVTSRTDLNVIDLGCGTGLCGVLFRPVAAHLVGVDLSPRMIEKSRERNVYDELVRADVVEALQSRAATADVILAADVFIYIGDLAAVFRAAADALRPGGLLAFTIEVIDDAAGDFVLRPTRRYAQSAAYIRRLATAVGLEEVSATPAVLRAGEQAGVDGLVFVLARPAGPAASL